VSIRAKQISMKKYAYAGWITRSTAGVLCIEPCPPLNGHEPPPLAAIIGADWQTGDYVQLRLLRFPDHLRAQWIGELTINPPALRVGCFDVTKELENHLGHFVVILACTEKQR
jgi:hypothetical protein